MYNDPAAIPAPEAGPSAGPSAGSSARPSTSPASGLAASIYAPSPVLPGSASNTAPASASSARRKFKHPRVSNLKIDKITILTGKDNYQS